jgi:hypothetical protein
MLELPSTFLYVRIMELASTFRKSVAVIGAAQSEGQTWAVPTRDAVEICDVIGLVLAEFGR